MAEVKIDELQRAVEGLHRAKAKYKEKVAVSSKDGVAWEGDVYIFELAYDTKHDTASKEQIAEWQLAGPTPKAVKAAEARGLKIRKALQTSRAVNSGPMHRAKLAYAWSSTVKGSTKRKYFAVLQEGQVKSPADAVKSALAKKK